MSTEANNNKTKITNSKNIRATEADSMQILETRKRGKLFSSPPQNASSISSRVISPFESNLLRRIVFLVSFTLEFSSSNISNISHSKPKRTSKAGAWCSRLVTLSRIFFFLFFLLSVSKPKKRKSSFLLCGVALSKGNDNEQKENFERKSFNYDWVEQSRFDGV
jgi:hypothetical protein